MDDMTRNISKGIHISSPKLLLEAGRKRLAKKKKIKRGIWINLDIFRWVCVCVREPEAAFKEGRAKMFAGLEQFCARKLIPVIMARSSVLWSLNGIY